MLECTASVMIAIDPVSAPAMSLSTISVMFETIDRPAALVLLGVGVAITLTGSLVPARASRGTRARLGRGG